MLSDLGEDVKQLKLTLCGGGHHRLRWRTVYQRPGEEERWVHPPALSPKDASPGAAGAECLHQGCVQKAIMSIKQESDRDCATAVYKVLCSSEINT